MQPLKWSTRLVHYSKNWCLPIVLVCDLILCISIFLKGFALTCRKCGEDGVCAEGVSESTVECNSTSHSCMLKSSKTDIINPETTIKDCFDTGNYKFVGCLRETSGVGPGGVQL